MSSEILLKATGIGKIYTGTQHPLATLRQAVFGIQAGRADRYPVLANIDITVHRGETVGIMGRNGAGKTTLLGILGNVIEATTGHVERYGRISTLLGLTAGFNPNFSGRENAYLFCSIQGLTRAEADERMEGIEGFADLGRYFELPLRTYSSGMQSRLAFACAIHVNSDLIIIDETLAVGDANFRMKCYDRIRQMKESGQTFLMVSHNQNLVANFCTRGVVLEGGAKVFDGATFEAVEAYKRIRTEAMGDDDLQGRINKSRPSTKLRNEVTLEDIKLTEEDALDGPVGVVSATLQAHAAVENVTMNFGISSHHGIVICAVDGYKSGLVLPAMQPGQTHRIRMQFAKRLLPGRYFVSAIIHSLIGDVTKPLSLYQNFLSFDVGGDPRMTGLADLQMQIVPAGPGATG
jgi:ABC-type polysaccharide/polyol phosphate transport system ATPase subunit